MEDGIRHGRYRRWLWRLVSDMAGTGGGYGHGGWYQTWQVQEVVMEAGIRHGRCRRWLWRLVSDKAGAGGGYGGWYQVQEVVMEDGIRHGRYRRGSWRLVSDTAGSVSGTDDALLEMVKWLLFVTVLAIPPLGIVYCSIFRFLITFAIVLLTNIVQRHQTFVSF
jgi:hypothetical protein